MSVQLPSTPFLAIDLAVMDDNIQRTAAWADARQVALRPHVKTHKSPEIARRQLAAGAVGITVATIGEAEVFARHGCDDLFIAYPLWLDDQRRRRLSQLTEQAAVLVGFDSMAAAERLVGTGVRGVVEIDSGQHRSGVLPQAAGELAAAALAAGLEVVGAFTFPGHSYGLDGARVAAAEQEAAALAAAGESLRAAGLAPVLLSGGSTPSLAVSGPAATELRPGVYVFNDAQQWELGACTPDQVALTCHATVVSHAGGRLVLDAGSKALGADRAPWASGFGRLLDHPEARIVLIAEHHAVADLAGAALPPLGSVVRVVPNHACNAVNLADEYVVFAAGEPVDTWPIAARGKNA